MPQFGFETRAKVGYVIVTLLLAVGMALSVHEHSIMADSQIARLRAEEQEITLVVWLRWTSELIVSSGRGYLLSGDPDLLKQVQTATSRFDDTLRALQATQAGNREGLPRAAEAEQAVRDFIRVQEDLLAARQQSKDTQVLVNRFETELLPLRNQLDRALDRLVDYKTEMLADFYRAARTARSGLERRMYALLGLLVLAGFGVAWFFGKRLGRAYKQELKALETARRSLATRDELMGMVAHDLRNPLGAITMKAALLRTGGNSDQTRQRAESIENIAIRMEYLIKSMLDAATMEAGRFSVTPVPCAVEDVLCETVAMFAPSFTSKQIRFEQCVSPGLTVLADRERVIQVLSNIIGNALKFTPPGGVVTLSVEKRGAEAYLTVRDTGPGIPREHLPRLFDRFWQDETAKKKGTGLGLFIAKAIVDAHHGRIWAESEVGQGATFHFTLPLAEPGGRSAPSADNELELPGSASAAAG